MEIFLQFDITKCRKKDIIPTICVYTNHMLNNVPNNIVENMIFNILNIAKEAKTTNVAANLQFFINNLTYGVFSPSYDPNSIIDAIHKLCR